MNDAIPPILALSQTRIESSSPETISEDDELRQEGRRFNLREIHGKMCSFLLVAQVPIVDVDVDVDDPAHVRTFPTKR